MFSKHHHRLATHLGNAHIYFFGFLGQCCKFVFNYGESGHKIWRLKLSCQLSIGRTIMNRAHTHMKEERERERAGKIWWWNNVTSTDDDHLRKSKLRFLLSNQFDSSWACNKYINISMRTVNKPLVFQNWIERKKLCGRRFVDRFKHNLFAAHHIHKYEYKIYAMSHRTTLARSLTHSLAHEHYQHKDMGKLSLTLFFFHSTCKRFLLPTNSDNKKPRNMKNKFTLHLSTCYSRIIENSSIYCHRCEWVCVKLCVVNQRVIILHTCVCRTVNRHEESAIRFMPLYVLHATAAAAAAAVSCIRIYVCLGQM